MNYKMILYVLGKIMFAEGVLMSLSAMVALYYAELGSFYAFAIVVGVLLAGGLLLSCKKPKNDVIYAREGFVAVALSWIALSLFGALPFVISGEIPSYIDAVFETVSGFTTTGSSILTNVEAMSKGMLFWRSFTHWVGGMGVLVFVLAIVPLAGERSMHIMRAEVPGPSVGKLVPKLKSSAMILYAIYIVMTLIEVILLLIGGMNLFEALVHAFGTAGTGGFSNRAASVGAYNSAYIDVVIGVFMILFGVNFNLYYFILIRKFSQAFKNRELLVYLGIVAAASITMAVNIIPIYGNFFTSLRFSFFQTSSIISTTGYATANFDLWPEYSRMVLVLLMFLGANAGSTAGGIKTVRLMLMGKVAQRGVERMLHPRSVKAITLEGKPVEEGVLHGVFVFMITYLAIFVGGLLVVSLDGFDFQTTFTAVAATLNNVGPGLGVVGPTGNFFGFSCLSKITLTLEMLFGRLEIFPMLLLFSPSVWKRR